MPRLNKNQRPIAVGMLEAGLRHVDVAEHLGVSRCTTISLAARYRVLGTFDDLPAQVKHELRRHFKTATFGPYIYDIAFAGKFNCRGYFGSRERPNKRTDSSQQSRGLWY